MNEENSSILLPDNFKLCYSRAQIQAMTSRLASEISTWAKEVIELSGKPVLALCVLRGGVFFFSDLLQAMNCDIEPGFCRTSSYDIKSNSLSPGGVRVWMDDVVAARRSILIVDDICDTGATLFKLHNVLLDLGAAEVKSVVSIVREVKHAAFAPTWSGFRYSGEEWFVGYGLDSHDSYRNLPEVYTFQK